MSDKRPPLPSYPNDDDRTVSYHVARTTIDAAASFIPGAGYAAGALVERFIGEPLSKRRDAWFERVGEGVRLLEDRLDGFDPESLSENEDFVSAVFEATQAAMKTAKKEKLEALRNGVLNIAAGFHLDDIVRGTFFGLVERYSPAHFHILKLLEDPQKSPEMVQRTNQTSIGSQRAILRGAVPETMISDPALDRIFSDLNRDGLADTGSMHSTTSSGAFLSKRTTSVGDTFIRFISEPV